MKNVDHIGIAVKSIDDSLDYYIHTLGLTLLAIEEVESQKVRVAFIDAGNIKLELLEPMDEAAPVAKFIEKKRRRDSPYRIWGYRHSIKNGLNLKKKGSNYYQMNQNQVQVGLRLHFLHPKSSFGVLYELCEKRDKGE